MWLLHASVSLQKESLFYQSLVSENSLELNFQNKAFMNMFISSIERKWFVGWLKYIVLSSAWKYRIQCLGRSLR